MKIPRQVLIVVVVECKSDAVVLRKYPISRPPFGGSTRAHDRLTRACSSTLFMAGVSWHYALKFIITGQCARYRPSVMLNELGRRCRGGQIIPTHPSHGPTLHDESGPHRTYPLDRASSPTHLLQIGVEFGSKLIELPEQGKVVKLQCQSRHETLILRTRAHLRRFMT